MSIWAKISSNGIVENIILADKEFINTQEDIWIESYKNATNTTGYNQAIIGGRYDFKHKAFIDPQPLGRLKFILDENFQWVSPTSEPYPSWWLALTEEEQKNLTYEQKNSIILWDWNDNIGEWVDTGKTLADIN